MTEQRYYFEARIYHTSGMYWTVGVMTAGSDLIEASRIFYAWSSGVMTDPRCENISINSVHPYGKPNRGYQNPNSPALRKELQGFFVNMEVQYPNGVKAP